MTATYAEVIEVAKGLLSEQIRDPEGERNTEYTRGIVELVADSFGKPGVYLEDRTREVAADIGVPL